MKTIERNLSEQKEHEGRGETGGRELKGVGVGGEMGVGGLGGGGGS